MNTINVRVESLDTVVPNVVALTAKTAADVLLDRRTDGTNVAYRFIQNLSGAEAFIAIGVTADGDAQQTMYHFTLADKEKAQIYSKLRVSAWTAAAGKIATLEYIKKDL